MKIEVLYVSKITCTLNTATKNFVEFNNNNNCS